MAAPGKSCEWSQPGHDPYMGDLPGAIDHYLDIPVATRDRLKQRMRRLDYDDLVSIRKNGIDGRSSYEPGIRQMHFGEGRVCAEVTRQSWKPDHAEGGLAYCEDGFCVLVPFVCRNLSRIRQRPPAPAAQATGAGAGAGRPGVQVAFGGQAVEAGASGSSAGPGQGGPGLVGRSSAALLPGLRPAAPYQTDFPGQPTLPAYAGSGTPPPGVPMPVAPPQAVVPPPPALPAAPLLPLPPITPRTPLSPVPEPGTGLLLMSGLVLLLPRAMRAARRRRVAAVRGSSGSGSVDRLGEP
jgi:hypothetical protein